MPELTRKHVLQLLRQTAQELQIRSVSANMISEIWESEWKSDNDLASEAVDFRANIPVEPSTDTEALKSFALATAPLLLDREYLEGPHDKTVSEILNLDRLLRRYESDATYFCPRCGGAVSRPSVAREFRSASKSIFVGAVFPLKSADIKRKSRRKVAGMQGLLSFLKQQGVRSFLAGDRIVRISEEEFDRLTTADVLSIALPSPVSRQSVKTAERSSLLVAMISRAGNSDEFSRYFEEMNKLGATSLLVAEIETGERVANQIPVRSISNMSLLSDRWLCSNCFFIVPQQMRSLALNPSEDSPSYELFGISSNELRNLSVGEFLIRVSSPLLSELLESAGLSNLPLSRYISQLSHGERAKLLLVVRVLERQTAARFFADDLVERFDRTEQVQVVSLLDRIRASGNVIALFSGASRAILPEVLPGTAKFDNLVIEPVSNIAPPDERLPNAPVSVICGSSGSGKTRYLRNLATTLGGSARYVDFHTRLGISRKILRGVGANSRRPRQVLHQLAADKLLSEIFKSLPDARRYGFSGSDFDPAESRLRCSQCQGLGIYLDSSPSWESYISPCARCLGSGFERELSSVTYQGHSIGELLAMPVGELGERFQSNSGILELSILSRGLGIGHLSLNRPLPTLGEGTWRRVILAGVLSDASHDAVARRRGRRSSAIRAGAGAEAKIKRWWLLDQPFLTCNDSELSFALARMESRSIERNERYVLVALEERIRAVIAQ